VENFFFKETKMENKRFFVYILVAVLLVAGVTACERSLSPSGGIAPTETTAVEGAGEPAPTDDIMAQLGVFATQTAMALEGQGVLQETPVPSDETAVATEAASQPTAAPVVEPTQAPVATAVPVPAATPGRPSSYTMHKGEHPYCIARRFDVNPVQVLSLSGLSAGGSYPPGTVLRIPQSGSFPANRSLKSHPTTYTVRANDSIYSIACDFGDVDPNAIAIANSLAAPYALTVGQTLQIP
jgi:LysM repeat protein